MLTIERYDASERDRWDAVVRSARARHFMFERAYMDYHADRFVDASWFVLAHGQPIAVLLRRAMPTRSSRMEG